MNNLPDSSADTPGMLQKAAAFLLTLAMFVLVLMFSVVLFVIVLTAGAIAMGYFWWRTRELRKKMREHPPGGAVIEGEVIEGEVIEGEVIEGEVVREFESRDGK